MVMMVVMGTIKNPKRRRYSRVRVSLRTNLRVMTGVTLPGYGFPDDVPGSIDGNKLAPPSNALLSPPVRLS